MARPNAANISREMFNSLTSNALDFLGKSISEIERSPKYSLINFCTAIELFLKARLMIEHWSLIYDKPEDADFNSFRNGDFKSATVDQTINRLKSIASVTVTREEEVTFSGIRNHRNKLVHFFHSKYSGEPERSVVQDVVIEQCRGWFHLYRMLTRKWQDEFAEHLESIEHVNRAMLRQRDFLQVKYEALLPDIQKGKERGAVFLVCQICGFEASREKQLHGVLIETGCLVCEARSRSLKLPCPECGSAVEIQDLGRGICTQCEHEIDLQYLLEYFSSRENNSTESPFEEGEAYCSECSHTEFPTVIPYGEKWLCLNCLTEYETVGYCEWCNELVTDDLEDSFMSGCVMCDGRIGWGFDD